MRSHESKPDKQLLLGYLKLGCWFVQGSWPSSPGTALGSHGGQAKRWASLDLPPEEGGGGGREVW